MQTLSLHTCRLLLGSLCLLILSSCAQTIQPWVTLEQAPEIKKLKIENYLLKQEVAKYRKKLMLANLDKRKLARKLQDTSGIAPEQRRKRTLNAPASAMASSRGSTPQKTGRLTESSASLQASRGPQGKRASLSRMIAAPKAKSGAQAAQSRRVVKKAPAPTVKAGSGAKPAAINTTPAPGVRPVRQAAPVVSRKSASAKSVAAKPAAKAPARKPETWTMKMRLFFGSGHKGTSPAMRRKLAAFVRDLPPGVKVRVAGHSDSEPVGGFKGRAHTPAHDLENNKAVSRERAMAVVRALMDVGLSSKRIQVAGFGASKPLDSNETAEGRAKNRRVEIFIAEPKSTAPKRIPSPSVSPVKQAPPVVLRESLTPVKTIAGKTVAKSAPSKAAIPQKWSMKIRLFFGSGHKGTSPAMRRKLAAFVKDLPPGVKVRVAGHSDNEPVGGFKGKAHTPAHDLDSNKAVSKERAMAVVRALTSAGLSSKRIQIGAFGASKPLDSNETAEGRAKNRRVEIFIKRQQPRA